MQCGGWQLDFGLLPCSRHCQLRKTENKDQASTNHLYTLPDSWLDNVTREEGVILIKALN